MATQYTKQEYMLAKNVSCYEFLLSRGYEMLKHGHNHKLKQHDSLVLFADGGFKWYSKNNVSGNAITLLKELENMPINEAIKELASYSGGHLKTIDQHTNSAKKSIEKSESKKESTFVLPERNSSTKKVVEYLTTQRMLPKEIVDFALENNLVYQDKNGNCIFVGYDENKEPKFATLRGTYEKVFRKDIEGSSKACGFSSVNKESNVLYVFESAIDSLSMMAINDSNSDNYLSLNGVSLVALDKFLKNNPNINTIITCLDNDDAGRDATRKIWNEYGQDYKMQFYNYLAKDINEQLILNSQEPKLIILESDLESINAGEVLTFADAEKYLVNGSKEYSVKAQIIQGDFKLTENITFTNSVAEKSTFENGINNFVKTSLTFIKNMLKEINNLPIDEKEKRKEKAELNYYKNQILQIGNAYKSFKEEKQIPNEIKVEQSKISNLKQSKVMER